MKKGSWTRYYNEYNICMTTKNTNKYDEQQNRYLWRITHISSKVADSGSEERSRDLGSSPKPFLVASTLFLLLCWCIRCIYIIHIYSHRVLFFVSSMYLQNIILLCAVCSTTTQSYIRSNFQSNPSASIFFPMLPSCSITCKQLDMSNLLFGVFHFLFSFVFDLNEIDK